MTSTPLSLSPIINAPTPAFLQGSALEKQFTHATDISLPETQRAIDSAQQPQLQEGKDLDNDNKQTSEELSEKPKNELAPEEQAKLDELQQRDTEVRAHEQAHLSAAGNIATSSASFTYTKGPDGKRYATGGEVSIDTSEVAGDPAATAAKADMIKRAALAPANPSAQDRSVAANAMSMKSQAQADLLKLMQETAESDPENNQESTGQTIDQTA